MPDPRANPRLTLRVWGYGVDVYIPPALFALVKQRVGHAAGEVLGEVLHGLLLLARMAFDARQP